MVGFLDIALALALLAWLAFALWRIRKHKGGCSGNCSACRKSHCQSQTALRTPKT